MVFFLSSFLNLQPTGRLTYDGIKRAYAKPVVKAKPYTLAQIKKLMDLLSFDRQRAWLFEQDLVLWRSVFSCAFRFFALARYSCLARV